MSLATQKERTAALDTLASDQELKQLQRETNDMYNQPLQAAKPMYAWNAPPRWVMNVSTKHYPWGKRKGYTDSTKKRPPLPCKCLKCMRRWQAIKTLVVGRPYKCHAETFVIGERLVGLYLPKK
jgi:hypothetical protein